MCNIQSGYCTGLFHWPICSRISFVPLSWLFSATIDNGFIHATAYYSAEQLYCNHVRRGVLIFRLNQPHVVIIQRTVPVAERQERQTQVYLRKRIFVNIPILFQMDLSAIVFSSSTSRLLETVAYLINQYNRWLHRKYFLKVDDRNWYSTPCAIING